MSVRVDICLGYSQLRIAQHACLTNNNLTPRHKDAKINFVSLRLCVRFKGKELFNFFNLAQPPRRIFGVVGQNQVSAGAFETS
jgi:hypothetical protein